MAEGCNHIPWTPISSADVKPLVSRLGPMEDGASVVSGGRRSYLVGTLNGDLIPHESLLFAANWLPLVALRRGTKSTVICVGDFWKEPLTADLGAFSRPVEGIKSKFVTFAKGVEVVRAAESNLESAENGKPFRVRGHLHSRRGPQGLGRHAFLNHRRHREPPPERSDLQRTKRQ